MNGPMEKTPSQIPEAVAIHRTMTLMLKTSFTLGRGECDRKGAEAAMEIRTWQTW
jgi:hypothetical protein